MPLNPLKVLNWQGIFLIGIVSFLMSSCVAERKVVIMNDETATIVASIDDPHMHTTALTLDKIKDYPRVFNVRLDSTNVRFHYQVKHFTDAGAVLVGYRDVLEFTSSGDTIICSALSQSTDYGRGVIVKMQVISESGITSFRRFSNGIKWNKKENRILFGFSHGRLTRLKNQRLFSFVPK